MPIYSEQDNQFICRALPIYPDSRTKQPIYTQGLKLAVDLEVDIITYPVSLWYMAYDFSRAKQNDNNIMTFRLP